MAHCVFITSYKVTLETERGMKNSTEMVGLSGMTDVSGRRKSLWTGDTWLNLENIVLIQFESDEMIMYAVDGKVWKMRYSESRQKTMEWLRKFMDEGRGA